MCTVVLNCTSPCHILPHLTKDNRYFVIISSFSMKKKTSNHMSDTIYSETLNYHLLKIVFFICAISSFNDVSTDNIAI